MGCLFNEVMKFCSKNNIRFIYREFFFVSGGANNGRKKKWNMLSVALFATLSQRQNTPHKFDFSVGF